MAARKKAPTPRAASAPERDSRDVLWPRGQDVPLSSGRRVNVQPWGIKLLREVSQKLPEEFSELIKMATTQPELPAAAILPPALDQLQWLAARTLGVPETALDDWTAEDLLDVCTAIWDVCIAPVAGKFLALARRVMTASIVPGPPSRTLTPTPGAASPPPSSS